MRCCMNSVWGHRAWQEITATKGGKKKKDWITASYLSRDHKVKKGGLPWTQEAHWKLQVTPWRKGGSGQGLSQRSDGGSREGGEQSADWLAARLMPVYSLPAAHMWVWGICGMWVTALSSSLSRTIIPVYIIFTKRTWPQVHYAKYKGRGCRGEAKKIWCEERESGSRVIEISVQSCSRQLFFRP